VNSSGAFAAQPANNWADPSTIQVIGCDGSGFNSLTHAWQEALSQADLVVAPARLLDDLKRQVTALSAGDGPAFLASDGLSPLLGRLSQALERRESVIVLASGDPLWFGIGRLLLQHLPPGCLRFHPAPTSLQLAFARLGRPWQDARWVSLHGRDPEPLAQALQQRPAALGVLCDPDQGGALSVRRLLASSGLEAAYRFWLAERLGHPEERLRCFAPAEPLPSDLDRLHLVVLIAEPPELPAAQTLPLFGLADGLWLQHQDQPGLMTKREVRIQLLADLELPERGVLWDVGAGVGSVGLEALRLRPQLQLWAIERRAGAAALIGANAARLQVHPAGILEAEAAEALTCLPDPDRVLVGGGGSRRDSLLQEVLQRLRPGGIVVVPLATLEALAAVRQALEQAGLEVRISQLQAWRGTPLGDGTRLMPLNPVLILRGRRT
jgi:precorrin-6B C5,15-methyltransferase / cobalt-precorrin-6B C5,C15-methyltransferase